MNCCYHTKPDQHTSCGSCFTTGKFSCLTWADQSPLSHCVVQAPSVSLVSGTISMYLNIQESSVTSAGAQIDLSSSFRTESFDILNHTPSILINSCKNTSKQRSQNKLIKKSFDVTPSNCMPLPLSQSHICTQLTHDSREYDCYNLQTVIKNDLCLHLLTLKNWWMNECDLSDAITETVAGALNKIKF